MEAIFDTIWVWIGTAVGGVTLAGIISAIIYGCLKGAFSRTIAKINVEKIAEKASDKGIDAVKKISFSQSIQPLAESELKKITEQANKYIEDATAKMQAKLDDVVNILEKLSAYFDNSIGVSEDAKTELKTAIAEAKNEPISAQTIKIEEIVVEPVKEAGTPKETAKSSTKVER